MLIRYPGSKAKLAKELFREFPPELHSLWSQSTGFEYREPFFGAGAVGFDILNMVHQRCCAWLNDMDPGIVALWTAVRDKPQELCNLIFEFSPSADAFYEFKEQDDNPPSNFVEHGFIKLALHRMSFSGLGYRAGGPIGGATQRSSKYNVECRWNPEKMLADVTTLHRRMKRITGGVRITCGDFMELVRNAPKSSFIYLDPPYYDKGPDLYKFSMDHTDHVRLADALRVCKSEWVLSYDDHPAIRELYSWARFIELKAFKTMKYTMATQRGGERPKNKEVAITAA